MGEEVFQLHATTPTYPTLPMSLYNARQEKCPIGSSFPTGVQQGLLALLVRAVVYKFPMATKQNCHWS